MNRALRLPGAPWHIGMKGSLSAPRVARRASRRAFTLIEMVMVLLIIAIMMGVSMPALESAFLEQNLRHDTHELALMVRTAMIQSDEQHRAYVIELGSDHAYLHPLGMKKSDDSDSDSDSNDDDNSSSSSTPPAKSDLIPAVDVDDTPSADAVEPVIVNDQFDKPNKLMVPDPRKIDGWLDLKKATWIFRPGQLCPATHVRMTRGEAYVDMDFNALTGNVESESSYIP